MASRRQQIWARAGGRCEYCQLAQTETTLPYEVDHIRARKHRRPTTLANTCLPASKIRSNTERFACPTASSTADLFPSYQLTRGQLEWAATSWQEPGPRK